MRSGSWIRSSAMRRICSCGDFSKRNRGGRVRRTGSKSIAALAALLFLAGASSAFADVEFYQSVDRDQVGVEDSFHLTIVASGASEDAQIQFPSSNDFEVRSRAQSTPTSYQLRGPGAS